MIIGSRVSCKVPAMMSEMPRTSTWTQAGSGCSSRYSALGMALGGPVIAYALRHRPPKQALLTVVAPTQSPRDCSYPWRARVLVGGADAHPDRLPRRSCRRAIDRLRHQTCASTDKIGDSRVDRIERHHGRHGGRASRFPLHRRTLELAGHLTFSALPPWPYSRSASSRLLRGAPASAADNARTCAIFVSPACGARYLVSFLTIGAAYAAFSYFTPLLEDSGRGRCGRDDADTPAYGLCASSAI